MSRGREQIFNPDYWQARLHQAREQHHAIYRCGKDAWQRIANRHREILAHTVGDQDSILDAGCGWGRLLDLLQSTWNGTYLGVDLSPDFVQLAEKTHPKHSFICGDLRMLNSCIGMPEVQLDWAVLISVRPMVINYAGANTWRQIESQVRRHAKKLLYLEYDENNRGSIE